VKIRYLPVVVGPISKPPSKSRRSPPLEAGGLAVGTGCGGCG